MTTVLPIGRQFTFVQNTVYALPARKCTLFTEGSDTFTVSTDVAFTASKALTLTNGQADTSAGFVRCTTGTPTVFIKTY